MDDIVRFILSLSVGLAVIIGVVRYRKIDPSYYPFFYSVTAALIIEIAQRILMVGGYRNAFEVALNVYSYVDFYLYLWLFHNWGLFNWNKKVFISIALAFFVAWLANNVFVTSFTKPNYYFFILYSFALIFFSVNTFNKVVVHERKSIFTNSKFWICLGIIIFYSFFIIVMSTGISLFMHKISREFRGSLQSISVYSNLLVNLLYAVAMIWVPRKKNYTSLF